MQTPNPSATSALPLTSASEPARVSPISYVRELGLKPGHTKAVLVGASVAGALALVAVVVRARKRRREADESSGVFGTIVKSALFAALQTVVRVKAAQLAAKALHHEPSRTPAEVATQ